MSQVVKRQRYENRQADYTDAYTIEYRREPPGHLTIWCLEHPADPHGQGVAVCHLFPSGRVCVAAGKEPRTLEVAEAIAFYWMAGYSAYVRTGRFDDTGGRVSV